MQPKLIIIFFLYCFACIKTLCGQTHHFQKAIVDTTMKDTFAFKSKWAYPTDTYKDDSGKFHSIASEKITAADTIHLFFTAHCSDKIQEDNVVNYCYATKKADVITLNFADYMPGYYIDHSVYIRGDSFYVKPHISYEISTFGEKMAYPIQQQQLILNKTKYNRGDTIIGYIDFKFVELWSLPGYKTRKTNLFFKGFFCASLTETEAHPNAKQ